MVTFLDLRCTTFNIPCAIDSNEQFVSFGDGSLSRIRQVRCERCLYAKVLSQKFVQTEVVTTFEVLNIICGLPLPLFALRGKDPRLNTTRGEGTN